MRENTPEEWNSYWEEDTSQSLLNRVYSKIAHLYRRFLIGPRLTRVLSHNFRAGDRLLHAGSGAGEVDLMVRNEFVVIAADMSSLALQKYTDLYPNSEVVIADITKSDFKTLDIKGVYNLGVMEHLSPEEIVLALQNFSASLPSKGRVILFWPPAFGLSVIFLHIVHFVLHKIFRKSILLHPDEPNKVSTKSKFRKYLIETDLTLISFRMSLQDLFTYMVITLEKSK
jgi:hypothetical protein